jgi:hypothetical protein
LKKERKWNIKREHKTGHTRRILTLTQNVFELLFELQLHEFELLIVLRLFADETTDV